MKKIYDEWTLLTIKKSLILPREIVEFFIKALNCDASGRDPRKQKAQFLLGFFV